MLLQAGGLLNVKRSMSPFLITPVPRSAAVGWMLLAVTSLGVNDRLSAQTDKDAVLTWARENSIRLTGVEPGSGFSDLEALRSLIGPRRLVVLGEAAHLTHEFLALRNRLFEYLVEELGFTAIAVESGFTESLAVNEYVQGGAVRPSVAKDVFSWTAPTVWTENQQLIEWMREYNSRSGEERKLRFYGIDLSGSRWGEGLQTPRIAVEAALGYLAGVDPELARRFRTDLQAGLLGFNQNDYATLGVAVRDALTSNLRGLVDVFEVEKARLVAVSGEADYRLAYRQAFIAHRVDALLSAQTVRPNDYREIINVRDEVMAGNVRWILDQQEPDDRLMLFVHNLHAIRSPIWPVDDKEHYPNGPGTVMGERLRSAVGDEMFVFGTAFGAGETGETADGLKYEAAELESVDGLLATVGEPIFALPLDSPDMARVVRTGLARPRRLRMLSAYGEVDLTAAFDAIIYVDSITSSRSVTGSR